MLEAQVSPLVITRGGKDEVVMVSYLQFMQLLEDLEDLEDIRAIDESLRDPEPSIPWEQVKKELDLD
jgi:PHD/YefM family antitoxin component YafN of YafNO toxin-antitoxin module